MLLSGNQLKLVVPNLSIDRATFLADKFNFIAPHYKINSYDILHEFIANVAHESGGFRVKEENLNYTTPQRLMTVWPSRFKTVADATPYVKNPRRLANLVYNGRMGNLVGSDDGYNYRGGGFIQLTGKDMYEKYRQYVAFNTLEGLAEAVRTDDYYALDSACWLFAIEKKLIQLSINDQFVEVVKRINGGVVGLSDRQAYYDRAKKYLV